jgi:hypothetical protein
LDRKDRPVNFFNTHPSFFLYTPKSSQELLFPNNIPELFFLYKPQQDIMATLKGLPTELKIMIAEHLVVYNKPITHMRHNEPEHLFIPTLLKLAMLDQHLYTLAREMYYSRNEFLLISHRLRNRKTGTPYPFRYPPPNFAHWIQRLHIECLVDSKPYDPEKHATTGTNSSGWIYLAGSKADWQKHFAPRELIIDLKPRTLCYGLGRKARFPQHEDAIPTQKHMERVLSNASVHMKAASVKVNIAEHHCRSMICLMRYYPYEGGFSNALTEAVGDLFRKDEAMKS